MAFLASVVSKIAIWLLEKLGSAIGGLYNMWQARKERLRKEKEYKDRIIATDAMIKNAKTLQEKIDAARENARNSSSSN